MTSQNHLDKRTIPALADKWIAELEKQERPGAEGFHIRLRIARLRIGLSQDGLHSAMRERGHLWTRRRTWEMENARVEPKLSELVTLAEITGADVGWLVVGGGDD